MSAALAGARFLLHDCGMVLLSAGAGDHGPTSGAIKGDSIMRKSRNTGQRHGNASWPARSERLAIAAFLALWLLALPRCAQESQMDVVLKRDKLIVGQYSTSPPLAYVDDNGELVGFEIDMAREIAKDLL